MKRLIILFMLLTVYGLPLLAQLEVSTFYKKDPETLFCKMDNPINISVPNVDLTTLKITTDNGTVSGEGGYFYVKPEKYTPYLTIEVFSNGISIGKKDLKVLPVPDPEVCYANVCGNDIQVKLAQISNPLILKIKDFDFSTYPKILSFTLKVKGKTMKANNEYLTDDMINAIKESGLGTEIIFSRIKCILPFGEERTLKDVKVTIIQ